MDAPNEYEPGVGSGGGFDGNLGLANLVLANHRNLFHVDSHNVANRTAADTIVRLKCRSPCPNIDLRDGSSIPPDGGEVEIVRVPEAGRHIRPAGTNYSAGQLCDGSKHLLPFERVRCTFILDRHDVPLTTVGLPLIAERMAKPRAVGSLPADSFRSSRTSTTEGVGQSCGQGVGCPWFGEGRVEDGRGALSSIAIDESIRRPPRRLRQTRHQRRRTSRQTRQMRIRTGAYSSWPPFPNID